MSVSFSVLIFRASSTLQRCQVHQPMVLQEVRRAPRATQEQLPESLVKRVVPGPPRPAVLLLAVEHLRK